MKERIQDFWFFFTKMIFFWEYLPVCRRGYRHCALEGRSSTHPGLTSCSLLLFTLINVAKTSKDGYYWYFSFIDVRSTIRLKPVNMRSERVDLRVVPDRPCPRGKARTRCLSSTPSCWTLKTNKKLKKWFRCFYTFRRLIIDKLLKIL